MAISRKHVLYFCVSLVAAAILYALGETFNAMLWEPAYLTGHFLFWSMVSLAALNMRKKMSFLPLGKVRNWVKVHIYLGWFVVGAFLIHIDFKWPTGTLETAMLVLFVLVAGSGLLGAFISKSLPGRLTRRGEEVIYERIPVFIRELRDRADELVAQSVEQTGSSSLADFYMTRVRSWMGQPRDWLEHLFELNGRAYQIDYEFENMSRYLNDEEKEILSEFKEIVLKKSDLDYHFALQSALKLWLFIHIPLTYALLLLALVHIVLAHAFTGAGL